MDDGVDCVLHNQGSDTRLIPGLGDNQGHALWDRPIEAGREIVKYDDRFSAIEQRMHHVASDVPSAAGDQDCHVKAAERALYRCQQRSKFD